MTGLGHRWGKEYRTSMLSRSIAQDTYMFVDPEALRPRFHGGLTTEV